MKNTNCRKFLFLFNSIFITLGYSETTTQKTKNLLALEEATNICAKYLKPGSASALNQIAVAFYTLGAQEKNLEKKQQFFKNAAEYFCKAAQADCKEAQYNAGLAYSKLKQYKEAALHYRQCIQDCDNEKNSDLALKAALNLSILVLNKNIPQNIEEVYSWVTLGKKYNQNPKSAELLQTSIVILTDINTFSEDKVDQVESQALQISNTSKNLKIK